ncbi:MAG: ABC transporter permease subunit [Clostridia bacterium]|nr:ABC transporter permease subunit [Clostridia bacterium]
MILYLHELKRNKLSLIIWASVISFMLAVCVLIYPEMSGQMNEMSEMFADMGSFSAAFGMDELNFGEFIGYFGIECGNTLGLGGALFAAVTGISALAKEQKDKTAEILLTLPVSRSKIITSKLLSVFTQVLILNLCICVVTLLTILIIGEEIDLGVFFLLMLSYFLMELEISAITFGISAFISKGGIAIGLGITFAFYFMNILSNLTEETEFLKYITPYGYTDSALIINDKVLDITALAVGGLFFAVGIILSYLKYTKKDIK